MEWTDRVDQLLYDGESERTRFELEKSTLVVTSHRLLAFVPESDGKPYRHVDRPNVEDVRAGTARSVGDLLRAIVAGGVGLGAFLVVTYADVTGLADVEPDSPDETAAETDTPEAIGSALEVVEGLLEAFELAILLGGLVALVAGAAFLGKYVISGSKRIVVAVDGGDDVVVPVTDADLAFDLVDDIEAAVRPDPTEAEEATAASGSTATGDSVIDVDGERIDGDESG